MSDKATVISILRQIDAILRKNGNWQNAAELSAIATIAEWECTDSGPALDALWGNPAGFPQGIGSRAKVKDADDRRSFYRLLVQLAGAMKDQGIESRAAEHTAGIYSRWLNLPR